MKLSALCAIFAACVWAGSAHSEVTIAPFGKLPDGRVVESFTLSNRTGLRLTVMTYGATVVSLLAPDRSGKSADVVLGFDRLSMYLEKDWYFGSVIGRFANRIAGGKFTLDGRTYHLSKNLAGDTLHGGTQGFHRRLWSATVLAQDPPAVMFRYLSRDGEEGFPGNLAASVTYALEGNRMRIVFAASTDRPTVFNPTSHMYFNLAGKGTVEDHDLRIRADQVLELDKRWLPTGRQLSVEGTKLDFRRATRLGDRFQASGAPEDFDHTFVLKETGKPRFAAQLRHPASGRSLKIFTDQPGLQFYPANSLRNVTGKQGRRYDKFAGVCLEPQHFPDSPNQAGFPSTVLRPGDTFQSETIYEFN